VDFLTTVTLLKDMSLQAVSQVWTNIGSLAVIFIIGLAWYLIDVTLVVRRTT
jgi:hypothetical protein